MERGDRIGKYEIIRKLGEGGMGEVYEARDTSVNRHVALKLMLGTFDLAALEREARILAQLDHPNIIILYSFERPPGAPPFLTMPLLKGRDLKAALEPGPPLSMPRRVEIIRHVLAGLAYSHSRNVIHRDISPSNIFLADDGAVKIFDFGIAHLTDSSSFKSGILVGKPNYMSPEQAEGHRVDARSDLFSVGAVLYELVAGAPPFKVEGRPLMTIYRIRYEEPDYGPLAAYPGIQSIVQRALRKDPADRYQSAAEFEAALADYERSYADRTIPVVVKRHRPRRILRSAVMVALLLVTTSLRHVNSGVAPAAGSRTSSTNAPPSPDTAETKDAVRPAPQAGKVSMADFRSPVLTIDAGGETMDFALIRAGSFVMGSPAEEQGPQPQADEPPHRVRISAPFYMSRYEVTSSQFDSVMEENPDFIHMNQFPGSRQPVEKVSFPEAQEFCRLLSLRTRLCVRLPTEAEWEFACRAGTTGRFHTGEDAAALQEAAWYAKTSGAQTHPVGAKTQNAFGLYDMHGNVAEWCLDWYGEDYYTRFRLPVDPRGPATGIYRVVRGGSINSEAAACRCSYRGRGIPGQHSHERGFRVVIAQTCA